MTDLTTYFPFTGGPAAAEADWGLFAQLWATDGVVRESYSEFLVQATGPASLNVDVLAGGVWARGYYGQKGTTTTFAVTPDVSNPRIDIVVARLNFATHKIELLYRTGVAAAVPSAPTLTRSAGVTWDICLAEVAVATSAASIVAGNITDKRPWSSAGGIVRTANVPSASPLVCPNMIQVPQGFIAVIPVTGTTGFDTITGPSEGFPIVILEFSGVLTVSNSGGNLTLARDLVTNSETSIMLYWSGGGWREIARSQESVSANLTMLGPASGAAGLPAFRAPVQDDYPATLWSNASPVALTQLSGITFAVTRARLLKMGKLFHYLVELQLTSATGSSGNGFVLTVPFTYAAGVSGVLGEFHYIAAGGNHDGIVTAKNGTTTVEFWEPAVGLLGSTFANAIGELFYLNISGELA